MSPSFLSPFAGLASIAMAIVPVAALAVAYLETLAIG